MASNDSALTIRAIAPAIFFMTVMSSLRDITRAKHVPYRCFSDH